MCNQDNSSKSDDSDQKKERTFKDKEQKEHGKINESDDNDISLLKKAKQKLELLKEIQELKKGLNKDGNEKIIDDILKEVSGGGIPIAHKTPGEDIKKFMPQDFASEANNSIFRIAISNITKSSLNDYFKLTIAQQWELYDRVGFFKGIVLDHEREELFYQGFLEIFNRDNPLKAVKVLYKKPKCSGYYENHYTFSEIEHQSQVNGVFNVGIALSMAYSGAVKWGLGVGLDYGKESLSQFTSFQRKIFITTNYFIPKVELSFDASKPCASREFEKSIFEAIYSDDIKLIEYIKDEVINKYKGSGKVNEESITTNISFDDIDFNKLEKSNIHNNDSFINLLNVLKRFGHFVPTCLTIGGRLYASNEKILTENESVNDVTTNWAAKVQAKIKSVSIAAKTDSSMEKSDRNQAHDKNIDEQQDVIINAIGGDGVFINDASKWAESLEDFTSWSLVKFEELIPSINILNNDLKEKCISILSKKVSETYIDDLLKLNAYFLFYKGFYEIVGYKALKNYFNIENVITGCFLVPSSDDVFLTNGIEVKLTEAREPEKHLWSLTFDGYLTYKAINNEEYVLSLKPDPENNKFILSLFIKGAIKYQTWKITGGNIINIETNRFLVVNKNSINYELDTNEKPAFYNGFWRLLKLNDVNPNYISEDLNNKLFTNNYIESYNKLYKLFLDKELTISILRSNKTIKEFKFTNTSSVDYCKIHNNKLCFYNTNDEVVTIGSISNDWPKDEFNKIILCNDGCLEFFKDSTIVSTTRPKEEKYIIVGNESYNEYVLTVLKNNNDTVIDKKIIMAPYIGGLHQIWHEIESKGYTSLISALSSKTELFAIQFPNNKETYLKLSKFNDNEPLQKFKFENGLIKDINNKIAEPNNSSDKMQGEFISSVDKINKPEKIHEWKKTEVGIDKGVMYQLQYSENNNSKFKPFGCYLCNDKIEVNGKISGIQIITKKVKSVTLNKTIDLLALRVRKKGELKWIESEYKNNNNSYESNHITQCNISAFVTNPIYIPLNSNVSHIQLEKQNKTFIAFQVQVDETIEIKNKTDQSSLLFRDKIKGIDIYVNSAEVIARENDEVVGLGVHFINNIFQPYLLIRKRL